MNNDQTQINRLMIISYILRTVKLIVIIVNISFFFGIIWLIYCELANQIHMRRTNLTDLNAVISSEFYLTEFGIKEKESVEQALIVMYFAFTSLSTVGFGDFYPVNDYERLLCSALLLFGVAIFSYIMGNFIEILDQFKRMNEGLDEGESLTKFLCTLQMFNGGKQISSSLTDRIQAHFQYRWEKDKNIALRS